MPFVYSFISARSLSLFHAHVRAHATYTLVPDFLAIFGRFYSFFPPSRSSSIEVILLVTNKLLNFPLIRLMKK